MAVPVRWLPTFSGAVGLLAGAAAGSAVFGLRWHFGAYEGGDFASLGQAIFEMFLLPILGAILGIIVGSQIGGAMVARRKASAT